VTHEIANEVFHTCARERQTIPHLCSSYLLDDTVEFEFCSLVECGSVDIYIYI